MEVLIIHKSIHLTMMVIAHYLTRGLPLWTALCFKISLELQKQEVDLCLEQVCNQNPTFLPPKVIERKSTLLNP